MEILRLIIPVVVCTLFAHSLHAQTPSEFDCLIEPDMVSVVSSPVDGVVERITVKQGDIVKQGQIIAELESGVERTNVNLAKAKAAQAEKIKAKEKHLRFTIKRFDRVMALYNRDVVAASHKDEAETQMHVASHELNFAKQNKRYAELEYQRAKHLLKHRTIRSPIDGVIVERYVSIGEATRDRRIVKIARINPLRVNVIVPGEIFGKIKVGMHADVLSQIPDTQQHSARVIMVDKILDPSSGSFDVGLVFENPNNKLPSGIRCRVRFSGISTGNESIVDRPENGVEQSHKIELNQHKK